MMYLIVLLNSVVLTASASDEINAREYKERVKQAYEWHESLSTSEKRDVQKNVSMYGDVMKKFNSLMVKMNESERIYVIEEYNRENNTVE